MKRKFNVPSMPEVTKFSHLLILIRKWKASMISISENILNCKWYNRAPKNIEIVYEIFFEVSAFYMLVASVSESLKVWGCLEDDFRLKSTWETPKEDFRCSFWNHTNQVIAVGGVHGNLYIWKKKVGRLCLLYHFPIKNL